MLASSLRFIPIAVLALGLSGCLFTQSDRPAPLTPGQHQQQLDKALSDSEKRLSRNFREQCGNLSDMSRSQMRAITQLQADLRDSNEKLDDIREQQDQPPEPIVMLPEDFELESCPEVAPANVDGKMVLGRTEWIWIESVNQVFRARVDSGATTSSLSARDIVEFERDGENWVRFNMVPDDDTDDSYEVEAKRVRVAKIRQSSTDELDRRPVVSMTVRIGDFTEDAEFTLTDRTQMTYPILLGRGFLRDVALIDVAKSYYQPKPELLEGRAPSEPDRDDDDNAEDTEGDDGDSSDSEKADDDADGSEEVADDNDADNDDQD